MKILNFKRNLGLVILMSKSVTFYSQSLPIIGFGDATNYTIGYYSVPGSSGLDLHWHGGIRFGDNTSSSVMQITNGKVGIGTTSPTKLLDIQNSNSGAGESYIWIKKGIDATNVNREAGIILGTGAGDYGNTFKIVAMSATGYFDAPKLNFKYTNPAGGQILDLLTIDSFGKVGIGTTVPDEKLTVKGKIHTQEVKVDMVGALVPDYVFASEYKLKSLQEVENYIKENKHLPEIPSAHEIEKNGLMLAEMNMSLLKKMEEMTLYMIAQEKKINVQAMEILVLKDLEERLSILEKNAIKH
jgi:hypothetical protein